MNVYKDIKQEIRIEGDLHFPIISDENYKRIVDEVSKELKKLAKNFLEILNESQPDGHKFFRSFFEDIIESISELENFREKIECCYNLRLCGRGSLEEELMPQSYDECRKTYNKFEQAMKAWKAVTTNGWLAARSLVEDQLGKSST